MFFQDSVLYIVVVLEIFFANAFGGRIFVDKSQELVELLGRKIGETELAVKRLRQFHQLQFISFHGYIIPRRREKSKRFAPLAIELFQNVINSSRESRKQKEELFDVYFSYVSPELQQCLKEKNDDILQEYLEWINANYVKMKREFTKPEAYFASGFIFFYAIF